jgi:aryl carrier-like protein
MDDAQDKFIEEHRARLAAESNLAIALQALAELRETHAAVLQELDELSAAVQVADQFIGIGIDSISKLEQLGCLPVTQATLHQQPLGM